MNDLKIQDMIETIERNNADEIKYTFEVEKDENEYIFTLMLRRKEINYD